MVSQLTVRVLLVDDNKHFLKAFKHLILSILGDSISVIDEAFNGAEAIEKVQLNSIYDIIFLDIDMPGKNGFEVAKYLNVNFPLTKVVAVSWHEEIEVFVKMFSAGANTFIVKDRLNETYIENAFNSIKGFKVQPA